MSERGSVKIFHQWTIQLLYFLLGLTEKSTNYMRGVNVYVMMITSPAMTNLYKQARLSKHLCKKYSGAND